MVQETQATAVAEALLCANARLSRSVGEALESEIGIPLSWYLALASLDDQDGGFMKMSELAARVALTTSGTTRIVDRIAAAGLIERRDCEKDRRVSYACITSGGRAVLEKAEPVYARAVDRFLASRLEREDLCHLERIVSRLHE